MATVLDDVGAYLVAAGLGLTVPATLRLGDLPATPNTVTCLREYPGVPPEAAFGSGLVAMEHLRVQVVCRGEVDDYTTPRAKAEAIYKVLAACGVRVLSGTQYFGLFPLQSPAPLKRDALGRWEMSFNVQADKEPNA